MSVPNVINVRPFKQAAISTEPLCDSGAVRRMPQSQLSVAVINPRFEPSFWGLEYALPLIDPDKRCWLVTGALPALAALAPESCTVELFDENVEDLDFNSLGRFDVIGVTGMITQRARMHEILRTLAHTEAVIVVGGPYVSVAEEAFEDLCDVCFIGEAEETWPRFLRAMLTGEPIQRRYEQSERTDMCTVPPPRYDLVKCDRYLMASVQFSRGCPFLCEFCDIITIFGRRPRLKTVDQMLAEFDAIYRAGFSSCFLVDDNFIGNKTEAKKLLRALIQWQIAHGFPLHFATEASINLADDPELIALMAEANIRQVFIGIESPRSESLLETRKMQNTRGDGLRDKLQRIRDGGLVIQGGFIVGFDNDDQDIFDEHFHFIQDNCIALAIVGILAPVPGTPLYERLAREGRLDECDPNLAFVPKQMSKQRLKDGYAILIGRLYDPDAYFARVLGGLAGSPEFRRRRRELDARRGPAPSGLVRLLTMISVLKPLARLGLALWRAGKFWEMAPAYIRNFIAQLRHLDDEAIPLSAYVRLCINHWHIFRITQEQRSTFGNARAG